MKNNGQPINVSKPDYDQQTKDELLAVLDSGWVGQGPKTFEFEQKFAEKVQAKYCVMTNSATSALDLCLKAYDITGGELVTTPMTFVSDAIVGEWNGMDVTFADIKADDLCLDPATIRGNPRVIIAVDSHGRLADIATLKKQFPQALIIEDAAHAMYTTGAGTGDITVWSFQAVKSMPIFDGGAITTNDENIYKKLRTLTWLGVEKSTWDRAQGKGYSWRYDIKQAQGIKAYMTDVQAVIGLGQLRRLDQMLARRQAIQARYNAAFKDIPQITLPLYSETVQYYTMQCEHRDELSEFLAENNISTSVHFLPLSETTYWKKAKKHPLPVTDRVWLTLLSLPVFNTLTDTDVDYIIAKVKEFYGKL